MPRKIRKLRADLRKAGFRWRPAKGSHGAWEHLLMPGDVMILSGNDGDDAQPYQERDLRNILARLRDARSSRALILHSHAERGNENVNRPARVAQPRGPLLSPAA